MGTRAEVGRLHCGAQGQSGSWHRDWSSSLATLDLELLVGKTGRRGPALGSVSHGVRGGTVTGAHRDLISHCCYCYHHAGTQEALEGRLGHLAAGE